MLPKENILALADVQAKVFSLYRRPAIMLKKFDRIERGMADLELAEHIGAGRRNHDRACGKHEIRLLFFFLVRIFKKISFGKCSADIRSPA
ncbi:hypothetical protein K6M90_01565 [Rhizobium sp. 9T]|uniref:hypothetical protein n=1 Tax=Rhizobium croatiense TaxID=2867516 RepID=UPI001C9368FD|nr:hypothetical protein [Rhizobium croatiense]MBY4606363.1 hypothetical protein [Rhizobium croatiense]